VKFFLEQCLCSVKKAINGLDAEVIIVDNNSNDGSIEYLQQAFSFPVYITNSTNAGFAKANNQALKIAKGDYILFLNPDTIVPEDCISSCLRFMQSKKEAGAMGIKMIDGTGKFLKESKRGFPSPWVAFCKMSGLSSLFPSSSLFSRYYLGHLDDDEFNEVDALAGAFLLAKKEVLEKVSGFDEQFFMYAEDIDLSYRIQKLGYKNFYFPDCTIIHFKGESTDKDKVYVIQFYKAMALFVRKHYHPGNPRIYSWLLESAIWLRSRLSTLSMGNKDIKKSRSSQKRNIKTGLIGDQESCKEASVILERSMGRSIVTNPKEAKELVVCAGFNYSYKKLIETIDQYSGKWKYLIHSFGSRSIVGSSNKNNRGEVLT
jgi:N-acetylglucosaminyl-diphospho-decaprenol L-rhamnosyltransferase